MHHPGPPRFTTLGDSIQLAPRNPDPAKSFTWSLLESPPDSTATIDDKPVIAFEPDVPGSYTFKLHAPDQTHQLLVRAYPDERQTARFVLEEPDLPLPREEIEDVSICGSFNKWLDGELTPTWVEAKDRDNTHGAYVYETRLKPGTYRYFFVFNETWSDETLAGADLSVEGPGRPRVHLEASHDAETIEITARTSPSPDGEIRPTVEFFTDSRDDLDRSQLHIDSDTVRIPRSSIDTMVRIHAVPITERHGIADTITITDTDTEETITIGRPNDPPEWINGARIYEIFPRAFAGAKVTTTFDEIRRRLPYLDWLGVDAIWFTPILATPTRHGYHVTDYFETATDLGSREEFKTLVESCHRLDIRVIFDLVINHTATAHPHFQLSACGVDDYRDWYHWTTTTDGQTEAQYYLNWDEIPNVNYQDLAVRRHMLEVVDEWAAIVDGFRADVAWGVPHSFWMEVRDRVKDRNAEFLLLEETVPREADYAGNEFDLHYHTDLHDTLEAVGTGDQPASTILDAIERTTWMGYPDSSVHLLYVENHDEDRYLDTCGRAALKAAVAATITLPGIPMIYYGQERGMTGYRDPMTWEDGDDDLTRYHRMLLTAYAENSVLHQGALSELDWTATSDAGLAYALETDSNRVIVALNFAPQPITVTVGDTLQTTDVLTGREIEVNVTPDGSEIIVENAVILESLNE